jgi:hypothetical protein
MRMDLSNMKFPTIQNQVSDADIIAFTGTIIIILD